MEVLNLRKDTSTPKETMWQTLRTGAVMAILLFIVWPGVARTVESFEDLSGVMAPEFHIVEGWDAWHVVYKTNADRPVRARFTIQTRTMNDRVLCTYLSPGIYSYSPNTNRRKIWSWSAWAETSNAQSCQIPKPPFRVCLRYDGTTQLGNPFDTPFRCQDFTQTRHQ